MLILIIVGVLGPGSMVLVRGSRLLIAPRRLVSLRVRSVIGCVRVGATVRVVRRSSATRAGHVRGIAAAGILLLRSCR